MVKKDSSKIYLICNQDLLLHCYVKKNAVYQYCKKYLVHTRNEMFSVIHFSMEIT